MRTTKSARRSRASRSGSQVTPSARSVASGRREALRVDDVPLERPESLHDLGADVSEADHPDDLAGQLASEERRGLLLVEPTALDEAVGLDEPPGQPQHQRAGQIARGLGDDVGYHGDRKAPTRGRYDIDDVGKTVPSWPFKALVITGS
jgi:hypothetical protein